MGLAASIGVYAAFPGNGADAALDGRPCQDATGIAIFVLDFRKPLPAHWNAMPGALLREVALGLAPGTELRVYRVAARADTPLAPIARLCVPDGRTPACSGRGRTGMRGVAQTRYCGLLGAVQRQVGDLAVTARRPIDNAFLVEAVDEAHRGLARTQGRRSLHMISDMLQHAPWYSHFEVPPERWDGRAFLDRRGAQSLQPVSSGTPVQAQIYYLPRDGLSAARAARDALQTTWRDYFGALGMSVAFHDQPVMPDVATARRRVGSNRLEELARQREMLDADRAARATARQRVEDARARLAEARARAAGERAALAARRTVLEGEEAAERQRADDERSQSARLQAALAERAGTP